MEFDIVLIHRSDIVSLCNVNADSILLVEVFLILCDLKVESEGVVALIINMLIQFWSLFILIGEIVLKYDRSLSVNNAKCRSYHLQIEQYFLCVFTFFLLTKASPPSYICGYQIKTLYEMISTGIICTDIRVQSTYCISISNFCWALRNSLDSIFTL